LKTTNEIGQQSLADRVFVVICLSATFGLAGCQQDGTAEKTGKKIDQATEKAGQELEGAKKSVIDKAETAGEYIDDSVITTTVKAAILNDPLLNASHIDVTTAKGVVKLSGKVDSEPSIGRAMEVASSQKHVKSVETDLIVNTISSK